MTCGVRINGHYLFPDDPPESPEPTANLPETNFPGNSGRDDKSKSCLYRKTFGRILNKLISPGWETPEAGPPRISIHNMETLIKSFEALELRIASREDGGGGLVISRG